MRMSRRAVLHGIGGGGVSFSYTGTFDSFGDASQGFLVLKTSGTLTIKGTVDLCLVGGGGRGYRGFYSGQNTSSYWVGGGGGAGGFVSNYIQRALDGDYSVTIGAGSSTQGSAGGQTSVGASYTANGGNSPTAARNSVTGRGTSGTGASKPATANGTNGEDGVYPWSDSANFSSYRVSGCGGGGGVYGLVDYACGLGGNGGGGAGGDSSDHIGRAGAVNTGGGGGGGSPSGSSSSPVWNAGGNGGSGVVFVRWGY